MIAPLTEFKVSTSIEVSVPASSPPSSIFVRSKLLPASNVNTSTPADSLISPLIVAPELTVTEVLDSSSEIATSAVIVPLLITTVDVPLFVKSDSPLAPEAVAVTSFPIVRVLFPEEFIATIPLRVPEISPEVTIVLPLEAIVSTFIPPATPVTLASELIVRETVGALENERRNIPYSALAPEAVTSPVTVTVNVPVEVLPSLP